MYEAVKDNQPLVAEDRIIEPETSLVEFSTSAVAVMEDVGTLQVSVLHSHWSRSIEARLSLVESFPSVASPAILCHKEPARAYKDQTGLYGCSWLVH